MKNSGAAGACGAVRLAPFAKTLAAAAAARKKQNSFFFFFSETKVPGLCFLPLDRCFMRKLLAILVFGELAGPQTRRDTYIYSRALPGTRHPHLKRGRATSPFAPNKQLAD